MEREQTETKRFGGVINCIQVVHMAIVSWRGHSLADGTPTGSNTRRQREQQPTCQAVMYKVNQPYHFTGIHPATMARVTFKINEVVFGIEVKEPRLCRAWNTNAVELQSHHPCLMADAQKLIEQPVSICSHKIRYLCFVPLDW